jgi:hypothetical protein
VDRADSAMVRMEVEMVVVEMVAVEVGSVEGVAATVVGAIGVKVAEEAIVAVAGLATAEVATAEGLYAMSGAEEAGTNRVAEAARVSERARAEGKGAGMAAREQTEAETVEVACGTGRP